MTPRRRSSERPTAVLEARNVTDWTRMPGSEIVDVRDSRRQRQADGTAEDVDEQDDEHDRLDRREHEEVGLAPEVTEVPHHHDRDVGDARLGASQGRCARSREPARTNNLLVGHVGGDLQVAVLARRLAGQLKKNIVERRSPQAHLADADAGASQFGGGLLDQDEALPRRRQGQPVGPLILLRRATADAEERGLGLVTLPHVGQVDLENLAADAVFELVAGPFRDHVAVVDDGDLVRQLIRFFEVLRRQQDRRPVTAQVADDLPDLVATSRIETSRRLVEEEHARLREEAGREVEPPSHAARVRLRRSVGGIGELEALEQLRRAPAGPRAREPEQTPEHLEVLAARQ